MNGFIVSLAGAWGDGRPGGGSEGVSPSFGDGFSSFYDWVYTILSKFLSVFGTLFDFMANPIYTWAGNALSFFGFSEGFIETAVEGLSKMKFFQMTFYDFVITLLPIYITIVILVWVMKVISLPWDNL